MKQKIEGGKKCYGVPDGYIEPDRCVHGIKYEDNRCLECYPLAKKEETGGIKPLYLVLESNWHSGVNYDKAILEIQEKLNEIIKKINL